MHLLYGEEAHLRDRRLGELVRRLRPAESPEYNHETFVGPDVDLDLVVASCETLPVFSDRRLVEVRNLLLDSVAQHGALVEYLRKPNPSTVLVMTAGPAVASRKGGHAGEGGAAARPAGARGKRKVPSIKELLGLVPSREEFGALRADSALAFVQEAARSRDVEIAVEAARELLELVGVDTARLDSEVEKAALYAAERRRIEVEDVEALARRSRGHSVFELTDALARADRTAVLRELGALLEQGAEPLALVGMAAWQLRRLLRGAALASRDLSASEIGRQLGIHWKLSERFGSTSRRLGTRDASRAILALRRADRLLKSSAEDPRLVLERTLLELLPG